MFAPRHTVESVTRDLIDGLDGGTIRLPSEAMKDLTVEDVKEMMKEAMIRYRRRERRLMAALLAASVAGVVTTLLSLLLAIEAAVRPSSSPILAITLAAVIVFVFLGSVILPRRLFRVREKRVELKTFDHVLEVADQETCERLVPDLAGRLRRTKELAR
jgi:hypothetical protein